MTENEAIRDLQYLIEEYSVYPPETGVSATVGSLQYCITALEEIQQYRKIGTVDQIRSYLKKIIKEVRQYREIGTVEECREAREKQKPKPPKEANGEYGYYICPTCGNGTYVSDEFEVYKFCLHCGQAIQWNENLEKMEDE